MVLGHTDVIVVLRVGSYLPCMTNTVTAPSDCHRFLVVPRYQFNTAFMGLPPFAVCWPADYYRTHPSLRPVASSYYHQPPATRTDYRIGRLTTLPHTCRSTGCLLRNVTPSGALVPAFRSAAAWMRVTGSRTFATVSFFRWFPSSLDYPVLVPDSD